MCNASDAGHSGRDMALKRTPPSLAEGEFLFEVDEASLEEPRTSFGGLPLFLRAALGVGADASRSLTSRSFPALNAGGGECLDDFDGLRAALAGGGASVSLPVSRRGQARRGAAPETVNEYYFRGDSACCETALLNWLRDDHGATGPKGRIGFAVSAPMMKPLTDEIPALDEGAWQPYREDPEAERECAAVGYYPAQTGRRGV